MRRSTRRNAAAFAAWLGLFSAAPVSAPGQTVFDLRGDAYPQYHQDVDEDDDAAVMIEPQVLVPHPPSIIPDLSMILPRFERFEDRARSLPPRDVPQDMVGQDFARPDYGRQNIVPQDAVRPDVTREDFSREDLAHEDARIRQAALPPGAAPDQAMRGESATLPPRLRRQIVAYPTSEPPGTIVIDTANTYLYYLLGGGRAIRYGIGVGREGFTWSGVRTIGDKQVWPDWHPPAEMIAREPYLPRFMAGGPGNPLGARALYLKGTLYRIHGTSDPSSIGRHVSSGCIRMLNEDVIDLYERVRIGAKVVVLPNTRRHVSRDASPRRGRAPSPRTPEAPAPLTTIR